MITLPTDAMQVPSDGGFRVADYATLPAELPGGKKSLEKALRKRVRQISQLQRKLYADNRYAVLLVFQAMDAAGKDGTIRAVMSGVNPAGCQVHSFKAPSTEELDHDFLWRSSKRLPERGRIGIFNRSYYEELLVVKVRPEFLARQQLPEQSLLSTGGIADTSKDDAIWTSRYESVRTHEAHLAANGVVVIKFWLNVSQEEQKKRFLSRLTTPDRYWKFSKNDLSERGRWNDYMAAYQSVMNETSRQHAPWYAIPADNKPYMRLCVAQIVAEKLASLPLAYPEKSEDELLLFESHIEQLANE